MAGQQSIASDLVVTHPHANHFQGGSFMRRIQHQTRTNAVLAALRRSLLQEQRIVSVVEYIVLRNILTPLQSAWLLLATYPQHCDCLALLNALYLRRKDLGLTEDTPDAGLRGFDLTAVLTAENFGRVRVTLEGVVVVDPGEA